MAHWAELNEDNVVIRVTVGNNDDLDEGYQWLVDNLGGRWVKTSYNGNIRVRYAGLAPNMIYNEELDAFLFPKPYDSWLFNESTFDWVAPVEKPAESKPYLWNEETLSWEEDLRQL